MIVVSLRSVTLAAVVATAVVAFGCGDDADGPEAPAATTPTSELVTPSPTPAATAVSPTDERLQEILDAPGLLAFLSDLEDAIEANDVQFVIDHTHFAAYECQSTSGFPAEPDECWGAPGHTLPAISYGFWQSEGGYWTEATYEAAISDRLTGPDAEDARMHAIGQTSLGDDQSPDVADVLIAGLGSLGDLEPFEGMAMSLEIAERGGEWAITRFSGANTELVPDFYDWWVEWEGFTSVALPAP